MIISLLAPLSTPSRRFAGKVEKGKENIYSCCVLAGMRSMQERRTNLQAFKDGDVRFLICTDVAARGKQHRMNQNQRTRRIERCSFFLANRYRHSGIALCDQFDFAGCCGKLHPSSWSSGPCRLCWSRHLPSCCSQCRRESMVSHMR